MPRKSTRAGRVETESEEGMGAAFSRASGAWIDSQATVFEHFDEMARRWLDRRREALDAMRQSIEEMRNTSDVGEMLRIQQEWLSGSMRRISADLNEFGQAAFSLPQRAVSQLGNIAEEAVQDAGRSTGEVMSAAGFKPHSLG